MAGENTLFSSDRTDFCPAEMGEGCINERITYLLSI